ncbi:succinate dehydrogenase assembly factor 2 [Parvibium lacunae]|uniref:FAD assembly factor SdhE n=2 Tax=Parvibium lacunae TaxID=1888893 RepID=A0A368L8A1_9BURK|nr:succinate dehydrogenase assembly factor 2 [Parvibium lacunae]
MLENDILLTRFLDRYEETLSDAEVTAFVQLLELADGDLMDLLMARKAPMGELATEQVRDLLVKISAS